MCVAMLAEGVCFLRTFDSDRRGKTLQGSQKKILVRHKKKAEMQKTR